VSCLLKKLTTQADLIGLCLNPPASQVIKHNPFTKAAIVVKSAFGREKPLQHQTVDQRAHHYAGLFHVQLAEDPGLDSGFYDLAVVAATAVVKLGVQVVKAFVACAYADKI